MQQAPSIKIGWKVMLAMGIYLAALGLFLVAAPQVVFEEEFGAFTEKSWTDFISDNPESSQLFLMLTKFLGAHLLSIAALVIGITLVAYRKAEKWSWYTLLISGIIGWGGALTYHTIIGIPEALIGSLLVIIGTVLFVIAIALPAKAILSKQPVAAQPRTLERPSAQREQQWHESKSIWALIIIILGAVVFGIVQPFIWQWVHKETPPPGTVDLANLLTIILALVALAVTGFAILAYRVLRHRLGESIRKELDIESKIFLGRIQGGVAFEGWRTWLLSWRVNHLDHELLSYVISTQIRALDSIGQIDPERIAELPEDAKKSINQQKSNVAGYIVYNLRIHSDKVSPEERTRYLEIARKYGKEAYDEAGKFGNNYDWKANYGALLKFFGVNSDEKHRGEEIISEIEERHKAGEISEQEIKDYRTLFGTAEK